MLKAQVNNLQEMSTKVQGVIEKQLAKAEVEGLKVLSGVAGEKVEKGAALADIYAKIRANNPSVKHLFRNVDTATYDTRKSLEWNLTMMAAYAKLQAEKAIEKDVAPKLKAYAEQLEAQLAQLSDKANELKSKLTKH